MGKQCKEEEAQPILGTAPYVEDAPKSETRHSWLRPAVFIALWYLFSTAMNIFIKQLIGKKKGIFGKKGFPAPFMMCTLQFSLQYCLAKFFLGLGIVPRITSRKKPRSWTEYFKNVFPNGAATGFDIGLSNLSYQTISLSFYVMCKSTTPLFMLIFAFLWRIERPSWGLAGVMATISTGLLLLVYGQSNFELVGFAFVMIAACLSGLRWTLTQILLQGQASNDSEGGPLEIIEQLTPVMTLFALLFSLIFEDPGEWSKTPYFTTLEHTVITFLLICASAILAFLMVACEFTVIKETSALTFMVAGTCKELLTVLAGVIIFKDDFGPINGLGMFILMSGVISYNYFKYKKMQEAQPAQGKPPNSSGEKYVEMEAQGPCSPVMKDSQAYIRPGNTSNADEAG